MNIRNVQHRKLKRRDKFVIRSLDFRSGGTIVSILIEGSANGKCSAFNAKQTEKEAYSSQHTKGWYINTLL